MATQTAENVIHGIRKVAAVASGAALGFITNNVTGAYIGGYVGAKLADMKRKQVEAMQREWKKRKIGSKQSAGLRKRRRPTKSTKWLKKGTVVKSNTPAKRSKRNFRKSVKMIVKGAMKCDVPIGTYHKFYVQDINMQNTAANNQLVYTCGQRAGGNSTPYTSEGMSWCPFNLKKLLDAASVVFNGKSKAINWEDTTNNFSNPKVLQVDVVYASYELRLKCISEQELKCKLVRGRAKKNFGTGLYDVWNTAIGNARWVGGAPNINTIGIAPTGWKELDNGYDVKVEEFTIRHGEEKVFRTSFKGCVDFQKFYQGDSLQSFGKGISESWNLVVIPAKTIYKSNTTPDVLATRGVTSGFNDYFNVEIKEVYKMYQPEITADANAGQKFVYLTDFPAITSTSGLTPISGHVNSVNEYVDLGTSF